MHDKNKPPKDNKKPQSAGASGWDGSILFRILHAPRGLEACYLREAEYVCMYVCMYIHVHMRYVLYAPIFSKYIHTSSATAPLQNTEQLVSIATQLRPYRTPLVYCSKKPIRHRGAKRNNQRQRGRHVANTRPPLRFPPSPSKK
jgi:hypothetical protein